MGMPTLKKKNFGNISVAFIEPCYEWIRIVKKIVKMAVPKG